MDDTLVGPTFIQRMSVELLKDIREYDYYQNLLAMALVNKKITADQITRCELDDFQLCTLWNALWMMLPDHKAIQRTPFNLLCDLCEYPEE